MLTHRGFPPSWATSMQHTHTHRHTHAQLPCGSCNISHGALLRSININTVHGSRRGNIRRYICNQIRCQSPQYSIGPVMYPKKVCLIEHTVVTHGQPQRGLTCRKLEVEFWLIHFKFQEKWITGKAPSVSQRLEIQSSALSCQLPEAEGPLS